MTLHSPLPFEPGEHCIVLAMRPREEALTCETHLSQAGYPVVLCPEEFTATNVLDTVAAHRPHLVIIDDDIEWAEGVPVVLRLHADPAFTALPALVLLRRGDRIKEWMWHDNVACNCFLSKPFTPLEMLSFVKRIFADVLAGALPPFPDVLAPINQSSEYWQVWERQLPPFALFEAALEGNQTYIEKLIARGGKLHTQDSRGLSALHNAAYGGHLSVIRLLLQQGVDVNVANNEGATPLWYAAFQNHIAAMRLLLESGADPNVIGRDHDYRDLDTVLGALLKYYGPAEAKEAGVALLLKYDADPNAENPGRRNASAASAEAQPAYRRAHSARLRSTSLTASASSAITPAEHRIVVAVRARHITHRCKTYLDAAGFPVVLCSEDVTAQEVLATVQAYETHLLIIDDKIEWAAGIHVVLRLHADPHFADLPVIVHLGRSQEPSASLRHDRSSMNCWITSPFTSQELLHYVNRVIEVSLSSKHLPVSDKPNAPELTADDWQAWQQALPPFALMDSTNDFLNAAWRGDQERIETLIAQGIDVCSKGLHGSTALHYAADRGNLPLVKFLLQQGAEVNVQNNKGETPLSIATAKAQVVILYLLLKRGADPNATNADGETALQRAHRQNLPAIEQILRNHGAQD